MLNILKRLAAAAFVLGLMVVVGVAQLKSEPQEPTNPLADPEPALSQVESSGDSTEAKLARAVKNCIIANENYVKSQSENRELKARLAERSKAADYWYGKARQAMKPESPSGHYETRCSGRKCHQVWVED